MTKNLHTINKTKTIIRYDNVKETFTQYKNLLGNGGATYRLIGNSCVSYTSRALWYVGVPNIGIHPFILHGSLLFRETVLYNNSFFINN